LVNLIKGNQPNPILRVRINKVQPLGAKIQIFVASKTATAKSLCLCVKMLNTLKVFTRTIIFAIYWQLD